MKDGWDIKKLGEVCFITMGQSPNSESYNKLGDGLPFFQGCSDFGAIHPLVTTWCNQPNKIANPNDILMSVRAPIGTLNIADSKCCIGRGLAAFTQKEGVTINKFLYYFLLSSKGDLQSKGTGATFKAIGKELIKNYAIKLPSLSEQQHIVEELDLLSSIIEKKKAQLKELDNLAQSLFYEMFGDPITNEKGWEIKTWKDVFETKTGKLNANAMVEGGKYPFFTCSKEISYIDTYAFDCEALLLAGNNASANYDVKYYKGKFNAYQRTYVLTIKEGAYPFYKISLEGKLSILQSHSLGGLTKYLTMGVLSGLSFIAPPISLQQQFASKIEAIERQKELIKQSIREVETLFNSRMNYYFN